jgi:hypothetical protein
MSTAPGARPLARAATDRLAAPAEDAPGGPRPRARYTPADER